VPTTSLGFNNCPLFHFVPFSFSLHSLPVCFCCSVPVSCSLVVCPLCFKACIVRVSSKVRYQSVVCKRFIL
jgi:hypothetical protein